MSVTLPPEESPFRTTIKMEALNDIEQSAVGEALVSLKTPNESPHVLERMETGFFGVGPGDLIVKEEEEDVQPDQLLKTPDESPHVLERSSSWAVKTPDKSPHVLERSKEVHEEFFGVGPGDLIVKEEEDVQPDQLLETPNESPHVLERSSSWAVKTPDESPHVLERSEEFYRGFFGVGPGDLMVHKEEPGEYMKTPEASPHVLERSEEWRGDFFRVSPGDLLIQDKEDQRDQLLKTPGESPHFLVRSSQKTLTTPEKSPDLMQQSKEHYGGFLGIGSGDLIVREEEEPSEHNEILEAPNESPHVLERSMDTSLLTPPVDSHMEQRSDDSSKKHEFYRVPAASLHVLQRDLTHNHIELTKRGGQEDKFLDPVSRSLNVDLGDMMEMMQEMSNNDQSQENPNPNERLIPLGLRNKIEHLRQLSPECGYSNQILVLGEEGNTSSPGYPDSYPTERNCYWNLKVFARI